MRDFWGCANRAGFWLRTDLSIGKVLTPHLLGGGVRMNKNDGKAHWPDNKAWHRSCSSKLVLFDDAKLKVDTLWAERSSCNSHELAALIKIVNAHKDYHAFQLQTAGARFLGEACRSAIQECLAGWEEDQTGKRRGKESSDWSEPSEEELGDGRNLELLKLSLAFLHLSEIFLPLLRPRDFSSADWDPRHQNIKQTDSFHKQGAVTAPLVRFLRYHYDSPTLLHPDLPDMLQASQPELFGEDSSSSTGERSLYWRYVEACVLRGCLTQAWKALERHSLYQYALTWRDNGDNDNNNSGGMVEDIIRGFHLLKHLLFVAPLPGGRSDAFDDLVYQNQDIDDDDDPVHSEDFGVKLCGLRVSSLDYKFWELGTSRTGHVQHNLELPLEYEADAAMRKHQDWQRYIQEVRPEFSLISRIPELEHLFDILTGKLDEISFSSWAERLCATLLFQSPSLKPRQVHVLALNFMEGFTDNGDEIDAENEILLDIMEGRSGQSIDVLYSLGGATGAALPTTLVSLDMFHWSSGVACLI